MTNIALPTGCHYRERLHRETGSETMRLVIISDTHGKHREVTVPEGDVLIHCGDFMSSGMDVEEIFAFTGWLRELPHKHKVITPGNHDILCEKASYYLVESLFENFHYLVDKGAIIDGVKFYGSPWTPKFMNWAFMSERGPEMRKHWAKIPQDTDVLVTHGPPYGVLDRLIGNGSSLGCLELREALTYRLRPKVHCFGHIHDSYGICSGDSGNSYVNASLSAIIPRARVSEGKFEVLGAYQVVNKPVVIDI